MSNHDAAIVERLLSQLLSVNSPQPELGARLKQRLKAAYAASGHGVFDEKGLGFRKFAEYLEKVHSNIVSIDRPSDKGGDILVHLKYSSSFARAVQMGTVAHIAPTYTRSIRTAVWQAFANPDPQRKRFFDPDGKVLHYLDHSNSHAQQMIEAAPHLYVQILPASQETQNSWMREFLENLSMPTAEKSPLEQLISEPYSSTLNATFTRALGPHGQAWSRFRTEKVTSIIRHWAHENNVDSELLYSRPPTVPNTDLSLAGSTTTTTTTTTTATASLSTSSATPPVASPREQVIKLLDLLSDDDLERLVLPTLLSTIMIKSRL
ncbi:hypothetical protein PQR37_30240 [Paraburkholderia nemoris]|uniref:hypothetical protein n=1 Tax=Paraburkholderia TaxID=1822464 RepID=UPI0038BD4C95